MGCIPSHPRRPKDRLVDYFDLGGYTMRQGEQAARYGLPSPRIPGVSHGYAGPGLDRLQQQGYIGWGEPEGEGAGDGRVERWVIGQAVVGERGPGLVR